MDEPQSPTLKADTSVPDDRLLPALRDFDRPQPGTLAHLFDRAHDCSEAIYNGDGSWGQGFVFDESTARWRALFAEPEDYVDWPTVRDTARRVAGYAWALDVEPHPVYLERMTEGVSWLLAQQRNDGSFPWWVSRTGMPNTDHLFYKNGYAGIGLLEAYRHLDDPRILAAVGRAADWTAAFPVSSNTNYNSLACWILSSYYEHSPKPEYLDAAVHKTVTGVLPGQLPNGGWAGHNSWVYYQGIIVAGLALLLQALPVGSSERERIERCSLHAVNNLVARQGEDGALLATFDPAERAEAEVRRIGYENSPEFVSDPHALLGLLWASEYARYPVDSAIRGLIRSYAVRMQTEGPESDPDGHGIDVMAIGCAWRWLARQ